MELVVCITLLQYIRVCSLCLFDLSWSGGVVGSGGWWDDIIGVHKQPASY